MVLALGLLLHVQFWVEAEVLEVAVLVHVVVEVEWVELVAVVEVVEEIQVVRVDHCSTDFHLEST